jgi:hypothetical protein
MYYDTLCKQNALYGVLIFSLLYIDDDDEHRAQLNQMWKQVYITSGKQSFL